MSYLNFVAEVVDGKCEYKIVNDKQEYLGRLMKVRVGAWMSWCLFLEVDCYMSASCLDEVREKIRCLNNNKIRLLKQEGGKCDSSQR
jgi:hypothetical protein